MEKYHKIVVSGDVDAGKSTLIGRFLNDFGGLNKGVVEDIKRICRDQGSDFEFAYLLDSFEEERNNQLTIDTTQVFCKSKKGRSFVFIDVPGHQELLKNMLSGASYADSAILVLDALKPVEEQTRRHAFILRFLGIERILAVVNKMDAVDFREDVFEKLRASVSAFASGMGISFFSFIPVSAKRGDNLCSGSSNMPWFKGKNLFDSLSALPVKEDSSSDFRFPVQDTYFINGNKVAVGEIVSGTVRKGDDVSVFPSGKQARVKRIMVLNGERMSSSAPENIGLLLSEPDLMARGNVFSSGRPLSCSEEISAKIFCSSRMDISGKFILKCLSQELDCRIKEVKETWDSATLARKEFSGAFCAADAAEIRIQTIGLAVTERLPAGGRMGRFILKNGHGEICAVGRVI